jgi:acyl-CoA thioesterase-2
VHSLHAYFLRPGDPSVPIVYVVDRIRDGRSFTTRRVVAVQHGAAIFNLAASFQVPEQGWEHQSAMPAAPAPQTLRSLGEQAADYAGELLPIYREPRPIDLRYVGSAPWERTSDGAAASQQVWLRADGTLPEDPLLHVCVLTYASDMTLLDSALAAHGLSWDGGRSVVGASLDHAMWFHRPFRADEWLLYDQVSPSAYGARALGSGQIFTADGRLVVSVVQEGLLRKPRSAPRL